MMEVGMRKVVTAGVLIGLATLACACGSKTTIGSPVASSPAGSTTLAPELPRAAGTTSTSAVPAATCRSGQLEGAFEGGQGAAGNWTAVFWVADTSGTPRALQPSVTVDLLDASGTIRMSASKVVPAPIPLGAGGVIPPAPAVARPDQLLGLAFVTLFWPTMPNVAGSIDGQCPRPIFVPTTVRISFGGVAQVVIDHPEFEGQTISICPSDIWVEAAGPL